MVVTRRKEAKEGGEIGIRHLEGRRFFCKNAIKANTLLLGAVTRAKKDFEGKGEKNNKELRKGGRDHLNLGKKKRT